MNNDDLPLVALPSGLSDEAAARLLEWLYETARVLEGHYAAQLHRYYRRAAPPSGPPGPPPPEDDPPF